MPSTFYIDEDLQGPAFTQPLVAAGIDIVTPWSMGLVGAEDGTWIPHIAQLGYVIVSADKRQRYTWEKVVIARARARVLHLPRRNGVTHPDLALNFVNTIRRIEQFIAATPAPFLATVGRPSKDADLRAGVPGRINRKELPPA